MLLSKRTFTRRNLQFPQPALDFTWFLRLRVIAVRCFVSGAGMIIRARVNTYNEESSTDLPSVLWSQLSFARIAIMHARESTI